MSNIDIDVSQEQVTAAEVTVYTASTASNFSSATITGGVCTNAGATDSELTVNVVKFGDSASASNRYFLPKVIFNGGYDLMSSLAGAGLKLKSGDFIVTKASVAAMLNFKLSIVEKYTD